MYRTEQAVARIASAQDGVITRHQLREAGLTDRQIARRVQRGQLRRLHRGVYLVGHSAPGLRTRAWAATLACGPRAAWVSHRLAAALYGLVRAPEMAEVTVAGHNPGPKPGILIHRVASLEAADTRRTRGLPITAPARTICDLAAVESRPVVEHALQEAVVARILNEDHLLATIRRTPGRSGQALLTSILAVEAGRGFTRSAAERALMRLIAGAGLPRPEKNVLVCGQRVDFLWRAERLIVEVDGYTAHGHRSAFDRDRRRDQALVAQGWRVIRFTAVQVRDEPLMVVARTVEALGAGARA